MPNLRRELRLSWRAVAFAATFALAFGLCAQYGNAETAGEGDLLDMYDSDPAPEIKSVPESKPPLDLSVFLDDIQVGKGEVESSNLSGSTSKYD